MAVDIKKDKNGTYYFIIEGPRDPVTNKRKQYKRRGFKTIKEARAAKTDLEYELQQGTFIKESRLTFGEFADQWIEYYDKIGHVKETTVEIRKKAIIVWKKYFNHIPLPNVTTKMYQDALFDIKKKYSNNTLISFHSTFRMILKRAKVLKLIKFDPSEDVVIPKDRTTVNEIENQYEIPKYLEKEQLLLFLETAKQYGLYGDYEFFLTLAYTGMRIGELIALKETDIDFDEHTISITKTIYMESHNMKKYKLIPPKTKTSIRTIQVEPIVINTLKSYIIKNKEYHMICRKIYYDQKFVFPNKNKYPGYPVTEPFVEKRMRRLLLKCNLPTELTPHSLRHTHTSLLAEARATLEEIMDRLGHKNDTTTKTIYLHVTKNRKKEASKKFGEMMKNVGFGTDM